MKVYARDCTIEKIDDKTADSFILAHHRQGLGATSSFRNNYGIFHKGELLGAAIFDNPRTRGKQRKYTAELYRLAFKENVRVIGGASKIIKNFIKREDPIAFFTYQSTEGESTDVYEHAGLTLVQEAKVKEILVADDPGAKRQTVSLQQAVQWGPDRILGTKIGEVWEDGRRVSNIELFLRNGYHLEERPGDRVYEWINPNVTHYLYKITSSKDNGYYIGRHSVRGKLSVDDCVNDGYWGSGGDKFKNWVAKVGEDSLIKTIKILKTREELINAEEEAIGENYKLPECKNTKPGGLGLAAYGFPKSAIKTCEIHGDTKHIGDTCRKCIAASFNTMRECPIHGLTGFKGDSCNKCSSEKSLKIKTCEIHGKVKHLGNTCATCTSQSSVSVKVCPIHGETKHQGDYCNKCSAAKINNKQECSVHGLTWFKGDSCSKCAQESIISFKNCSKHGKVKHQGDNCFSCMSEQGFVYKNCEKHGLVRHYSVTGDCLSCGISSINNEQQCPIHGLTWFKGDNCAKCSSKKAFEILNCSTHGMVKHQSGVCSSCTASKVNKVLECPVHGESKHVGSRCRQCVADATSEARFRAKLEALAALGFDSVGLKKAFENSSQSRLVEHINGVAEERLVSRPAVKKVLEFYELIR